MTDKPCVYVRFDGSPPQEQLAWLLESNAEAANDGFAHWFRLRIPADQSVFENQLAKLSGQRFVAESGVLRHPDKTVPTTTVPDLKFLRLRDKFELDIPPAGFPQATALPCPNESHFPDGSQRKPDFSLRWQRTKTVNNPAALIVSLTSLSSWASRAAQARLDVLQWAICGREAIVIGSPLPPIDGIFLVDHERILIRAGFHWTPDLPPRVVAEIFERYCESEALIDQDTLFVWRDENHWMPLRQASLSSIRRVYARLCC